jgi:hypothetical protein
MPSVAALVVRGVRRAFAAEGVATMTEVALASGRRADVMAVDGRAKITIVEVKSCVADFRADRKWQDYRDFCDRFLFAVPADFPQELIPDDCGLMVADGYDAAVLRAPADHPLPGARRKAVLVRFALAAGGRLHRLEDPGALIG